MTRQPGSRLLALVIVSVLIVVTGVGFAFAQQTDSNELAIGETTTGTLDVQNFARTYTFQGHTGDLVTITAESQSAGLALALLLTDPNGQLLNRASEPTRPNVSIEDVALTTDGLYVVTVMRLTGAQGNTKGNFTLTLTGTPSENTGGNNGGTAATEEPAAPTASSNTANTAAPTIIPTTGASVPALITLDKGLSVQLSWTTADDMNLEVRDPVGGAVNFRTATSPSGGRLERNVNSDCASASAANPSETVNWPGGNVATGSYEIIIYYNQKCTSSAVAPPAESTAESGTNGTSTDTIGFVITVTVNGDALEPIRGTLNPNQQYIASFRIEGPDRVTLMPGGPNVAIRLDPFANKIAAPSALNIGATVTGNITTANPVDTWVVDVPANAPTLTISMVAASGSLDPLVVLLNGSGTLLATNDDANDTTRNSQLIQSQPAAGRYIIMATRFGLDIGGTEGAYTLAVNTQAVTAANSTAVPTTAGVTNTGNNALSLPSGSIEITLQWNTRADLRLLIRDPEGVSVYADKQAPDNSGIMERLGNFKCTNTTSSPTTYAYWPANFLPAGTYEVSVWMQDRCEDQQSLPLYTLTVRVRGQQVIKIDERPDPNKIHLLTTFTVDANGNATAGLHGQVEGNFTQDISSIINNDPPVLAFASPTRGTIDETKAFEVYSFEAKRNDRVAIVMRNVGGNLDPNLFLLNSAGVQIAVNDDVTPGTDSNSRIEQKIPADGKYFVVASRYGVELGGTKGSYELTIAQLNP